jgi:antitoxin component YwqK of YwqJK toxin-antitoxin module
VRILLLTILLCSIKGYSQKTDTLKEPEKGFYTVFTYVNDTIVKADEYYYLNNQLRCSIPYKNGLKHNVQSLVYDANGNRVGFECYQRGCRNPMSCVWAGNDMFTNYSYSNDTLFGPSGYLNGKSGRFLNNGKPNGDYNESYTDGELKRKAYGSLRGKHIDGNYITFYPNKKIRTYMVFNHGKIVEIKEIHKPNGDLINPEDYFKKLDTFKVYTYLEFESEKYIKPEAYKLTKYPDPILNGEQTEYYADTKNISFFINYVFGLAEGAYKKYHTNGKLAIEGSYICGIPIGEWKHYNEQGDIIFYHQY